MAWKSGRGVVILDQLDWSGRYLEAVGLKLERRDGAVRLPHEDPERTAEALAGAVLALRRRMAIIAENVANAETARMPGAAEAGAPPQPYRRKVLNIGALGALEVAADGSAFRRVYRPAHSEADKDGRVQLPNVYVEVEMADWRSSAREYESLRGALGLVSTRYAAPPAELLPVPVPPPAYEEKPAIPVPAPAAPEAKPVLPTPSPVPPKAP
ncbi:MAG TPA: hypothetical protein PK280_03085 [Planctomycetota bacterium]|nr:hypothetical protein [Planctomycetota bacterium]